MLAETVQLAGTTIVDGSTYVLEEADWGAADPRAVIAQSGDTEGGAALRPVRRELREVRLTISTVATTPAGLARAVGVVAQACEAASRRGGDLVRIRAGTGETVRAAVAHATLQVETDQASVLGRRARMQLRALVEPTWRGDPIGPRFDGLAQYPGAWALVSGTQVLRLRSSGSGWESFQAGTELRWLPTMPALRCWHLTASRSDDGTGTSTTAGFQSVCLRTDAGNLLEARYVRTTTSQTLSLVLDGTTLATQTVSANYSDAYIVLQVSDGGVLAYTEQHSVTATVDASLRWRPAMRTVHAGQVLNWLSFDCRPNGRDIPTPAVAVMDIPGDAPADAAYRLISFGGRSSLLVVGSAPGRPSVVGQPQVSAASGTPQQGATLTTRAGSIGAQVVRATAFEISRVVLGFTPPPFSVPARVYVRAWVDSAGATLGIQLVDTSGAIRTYPGVDTGASGGSGNWVLVDLGVVDFPSVQEFYIYVGGGNVVCDLDQLVFVPTPLTAASWSPELRGDPSATSNQSDGFVGASGPLAGRVAPSGGTWGPNTGAGGGAWNLTGNGFVAAILTPGQSAINALGTPSLPRIAGCIAAAFDPTQWPPNAAVGVHLCAGAQNTNYQAIVFVGGDNQCYARFERYSSTQGNLVYATVPVPNLRFSAFMIAGAIWPTGHWALWCYDWRLPPQPPLAMGRNHPPDNPTGAQGSQALVAYNPSGNTGSFAPIVDRYFGAQAPPILPTASGNVDVTLPNFRFTGARPQIIADSDGMATVVAFAPPTAPGVGIDDSAPWPNTRIEPTITPRYTIAPWDR